jgi:hypothetical protein
MDRRRPTCAACLFWSQEWAHEESPSFIAGVKERQVERRIAERRWEAERRREEGDDDQRIR